MKLLGEIFRDDEIIKAGKAITRQAVRGIIIENQKILMIHSLENGDYKFPGGGVIDGESHEKALVREVREESGAEVTEIEMGFGKVIEYAIPLEKEFDVFEMTSHYYVCKIGEAFGEQQLEQYEQDLGYTACWVSVDEALHVNKALICEKPQNLPRWTRRETLVLEQIKANLL